MLYQLNNEVKSIRVGDKPRDNINYDACDVTLSVYPHRVSLKNMLDHGGNRTYAFGIPAQLMLRGQIEPI